MSLVVWLPLIENTNNQGNDTCTPQATGVTIDNNGKIGKCHYFSGSTSSYINTNYSTAIGTSDFTISMWLKLPTISSGSYYAICTSKTNAAAGAGFGIYWNYSQKKFLWSTADGSSATEIWMATTVDTIVYDKWIHLVMVRNSADNKKGYFYINGTRYELASTPAVRNITTDTKMHLGKTTNNYYPTKMYINDFRIYNEALSPLQIHELSQGLVLHYKFDKPQPNLLKLIPKSYTPTSYCGYQLDLTENLVAGQTYTLQLWDVEVTHSAKSEANTGVWVYWGGGSVHLFNFAGPTYFTNHHASYLYKTFTVTSSNASGSGATNLWLNLYNSVGYVEGTMNMKIGAWKLEKGDKPTPWTKTTSEQSTLATYIPDNSGYNNNGIITGNVNFYGNSAHYSACTYIPSGNTDYITTTNVVGNFSSGITMSIWFKSANKSPGNGYHEIFNIATATQNFEFAIYQSGFFRGGMVINGTRYVDNTDNTNLTDGNWHMLTMTYDGSILRRYVDGIDKKDTNISGTLTSTSCKFLFGHYGNNTSYYAKEAYLNDARIYCTALSAADIKNLYETSMFIDNNSNVLPFELSENSFNYIKKTGTLNDDIIEPFITLSDGSNWQLLLFHKVDNGTRLFTSSNATYCNNYGLFSRLAYINNFTYNNKYEFYVIQDGKEFRWTQTSQPTASSIAGKTVISGYLDPVNGLAKASQSNTYIGYNAWWGACGCWTQCSTGGKTGIPGFGSHDANGMCTDYLALYVRIEKPHVFKENNSIQANEFIER